MKNEILFFCNISKNSNRVNIKYDSDVIRRTYRYNNRRVGAISGEISIISREVGLYFGHGRVHSENTGIRKCSYVRRK